MLCAVPLRRLAAAIEQHRTGEMSIGPILRVARSLLRRRANLPLLCALLVGCIGAPGGAAANPPNVWAHQCITDLETEEEVCTTELLTIQDGVEFVLYFAHNPDGPAPLVVIGLEETFVEFLVTVDDKEPMRADQCEVGMCYFDAEKSTELLKQFKRGKKAHLRVEMEGDEVVLDKVITLRGFSAEFVKFALKR